MSENGDNALVVLKDAARELQGEPFHPSRELALSLVNAAQHALEQAKTPKQANEVRKGLRLIEEAFSLRNAELVDSNLVVSQRLRTEWKLGFMLRELPREQGKFGGGGPKSTSLPGVTKYQQALDDIRASRKLAWHWERISEIDEDQREVWINEHLTDTDFELSTASLFGFWRFLNGSGTSDPKPAPPGIYNVIYADPPWPYDNQMKEGSTSLHYGSMPLEDICKLLHTTGLGIAPDAVLFMWVTNPFLKDALSVVEAWGFEYKTNLVWVKTELEKPGIGFYVRGRHELLFICTRGSFTPLAKDISPPIGSVITAPVQDHSRKPQEVYDLIERLYPKCNYVELFARSKREGWKSWGNEVE